MGTAVLVHAVGHARAAPKMAGKKVAALKEAYNSAWTRRALLILHAPAFLVI